MGKGNFWSKNWDLMGTSLFGIIAIISIIGFIFDNPLLAIYPVFIFVPTIIISSIFIVISLVRRWKKGKTKYYLMATLIAYWIIFLWIFNIVRNIDW